MMSPAGCGHLGGQPLCRKGPHIGEVCPAQGAEPRVGVTRVAGQVTIVTLKYSARRRHDLITDRTLKVLFKNVAVLR